MSDFFHLIFSNTLYFVLVACVLVALIFFIIKKMVKLIIYALIILLLFFTYIYFTGTSVSSVIEPVKKTVKKVEHVVNEDKTAQKIKEKVENTFKNDR
jgi:Ca2+/Na+ antiporter